MAKRLILASTSPRRRELLKQVSIPFVVRTTNVNESLITTNEPFDRVKQLATIKGRKVSIEHKNEIILSADTVVTYEQEIYGKPTNKNEAYEMISSLSGKVHDVYTGVMIRSINKELVFVEKTAVEFWPIPQNEINAYISTNEPYDKAGAYGIQSLGAIFVKRIIGDYYNVVGLPISRVVRELRRFGVESFI